MSLNLDLFRLIPLSGIGRVGPQPKVFALGTDETLTLAQAAGYIDDLVNLKVPYANREIVPGDLIMLRYSIGGVTPDLPAWSLQQVTWTSDTYTLVDAFSGASGGAVTSVFGRTGDVVAADGDYTASQITNVPTGNITSTKVQAALEELDNKKAALSGALFTGKVEVEELGYTPSANPVAGIATLVAGVVTITCDKVQEDSVIVFGGRNTNSSPAIGTLFVTLTAIGNTFQVSAINAGGGVETTDVSSFSWFIINPPT